MEDAQRRSWVQHLRLLPGGDGDAVSALVATAILYVVLLGVGGVLSAVLFKGFQAAGDATFLTGFSLANALPCMVIALWTGYRIHSTKPIAVDEAAADLGRRRVYFGDEVPRVPNEAVVLSIRPRQVTIELADERKMTLFFRVNGDPDDVLALARILQREPALELETYVRQRAQETAGELLPDPDGVREALIDALLKRGVVVTRTEVA